MWPTIVEVNESGRPGIPLHNNVPEKLAAVLAISVGPEPQQRMQGSRVAILGCNVQGIVPSRILRIYIGPMRQKVRHTLCVPRRPASHGMPLFSYSCDLVRSHLVLTTNLEGQIIPVYWLP